MVQYGCGGTCYVAVRGINEALDGLTLRAGEGARHGTAIELALGAVVVLLRTAKRELRGVVAGLLDVRDAADVRVVVLGQQVGAGQWRRGRGPCTGALLVAWRWRGFGGWVPGGPGPYALDEAINESAATAMYAVIFICGFLREDELTRQ